MLKEIKIELTNKCSRNCKHCSSNATSNINNLKSLDFKNVCKIINEAKIMGVNNIVFTGGEPLMYDKLFELVELTHKLNMNSTLYTFAYRTDNNLKKYKKLIELGLNKIIYSLADSLSNEEDISIYNKEEFFDEIFKNTNAKLGFHYAISKDSYSNFKDVITKTINTFKSKKYFDKISLLRFVPHGKGSEEMDLSKEELLEIKDFYLNFDNKEMLRLGSPWNILGIKNSPCVIADEIMIIGFDGIAYPCDSIKYFTKLGISGNIKDKTLEELYNSKYFKNIRKFNTKTPCHLCKNYKICKGGCIGQKIIANYTNQKDKVKELKRCIDAKDPKCLR